MPILALDHLDAHPLNANIMADDAFDKLVRHISQANHYPPLIVRPHPDPQRQNAGRFQILDGHHRARALRHLGFHEARCEVWHVDDARAVMLLLTLNRLHGNDDPAKRGRLLHDLSALMDLREMSRWLPDHTEHIQSLIALAQPPQQLPLAPPPDPDDMPQAVTFFLTEPARANLFAKLRALNADRSAALVQLLNLDQNHDS